MENFKTVKRLALLIILFHLGICVAFGQATKPAAKSAAKPTSKKPAAALPAAAKATEISGAEWSAIVDAFDKENWTLAALMAQGALGKLAADNDKKQLARLRYFYLYALAGKAAAGQITYAELKKIADRFIGKEFLMPSRQFLSRCAAKVNYICPVADNEKVLRVTATNRSGSAIHSFEYVKFSEKVNAAVNEGKEAFLGGVLEAAEINLYKQNIRIMRLIFDQGFVNIASNR